MEKLVEIFTIKNILIYLIVINVIGFLAMLVDKQKAKKGAWRIPEKTLMIIALLGGSIGGILGMYTFRHKTKKARFFIGFPVILISEVVIVIYMLMRG